MGDEKCIFLLFPKDALLGIRGFCGLSWHSVDTQSISFHLLRNWCIKKNWCFLCTNTALATMHSGWIRSFLKRWDVFPDKSASKISISCDYVGFIRKTVSSFQFDCVSLPYSSTWFFNMSLACQGIFQFLGTRIWGTDTNAKPFGEGSPKWRAIVSFSRLQMIGPYWFHKKAAMHIKGTSNIKPTYDGVEIHWRCAIGRFLEPEAGRLTDPFPEVVTLKERREV